VRRLRISARSHVGLVRAANEDMALVGRSMVRDDALDAAFELDGVHRPLVIAVADGMGGHRGGAEASARVTARLADAVGRWAPDCSADELSGGMREALFDAHRELAAIGDETPELAGLGTTLTALVVTGAAAVLAHAGDSRAYRLRDGILTLLTRDHTVRAATNDPLVPRNILLNSIGGGGDYAHVDCHDLTGRLLAEDTYVLCTDGVADESTDDAELAAALAAGAGVDALIELALRRGGADNLTAIRVDVVE
jgi:protein phosphatase